MHASTLCASTLLTLLYPPPSLVIGPPANHSASSPHYAPQKWTKQETDHLFRLCSRFDLRFILVADRYNDPALALALACPPPRSRTAPTAALGQRESDSTDAAAPAPPPPPPPPPAAAASASARSGPRQWAGASVTASKVAIWPARSVEEIKERY